MDVSPGILELTLSTRFVAGSNVKGSVVGAGWRFALPSLELGHCVCLGTPSRPTVAALAQTAQRVTVLAEDPRALEASLAAASGGGTIEVGLDPCSGGSWPTEGSADLVVLCGRRWQRRFPARLPDLERLLSPAGVVYAERPGRGAAAENGCASLWLAPPTGEVTAVAPADDAAARRFLERHLRAESGVRRRPPDRLRRLVLTSPLAAAVRPRPALLAGRSSRPHGPPAYIAELAREAGHDLEGWRWGITAPGRYSSKKVICFLFPPGADRPERIVKLTRDPAFNGRLENEYRALSRLAERWPGGRSTFPGTLFLGRHAGLAVAGQTHLDGVPLPERATGRPDCPAARAGLGWLTELAVATVEAVSPQEVASALASLLGQYRSLYRPPEKEAEFLERQLALIGDSADPFPVVFQHGDPGIWNALATDSGVAFLDWEAAEPRGMPLWDVFYFARSATPAPRGAARRPDVTLLATVLGRYCESIGLRRDLAPPLLYACWMHRALKEATRLPAERLPQGQFVTLLRQCIALGTGLETA